MLHENHTGMFREYGSYYYFYFALSARTPEETNRLS